MLTCKYKSIDEFNKEFSKHCDLSSSIVEPIDINQYIQDSIDNIFQKKSEKLNKGKIITNYINQIKIKFEEFKKINDFFTENLLLREKYLIGYDLKYFLENLIEKNNEKKNFTSDFEDGVKLCCNHMKFYSDRLMHECYYLVEKKFRNFDVGINSIELVDEFKEKTFNLIESKINDSKKKPIQSEEENQLFVKKFYSFIQGFYEEFVEKSNYYRLLLRLALFYHRNLIWNLDEVKNNPYPLLYEIYENIDYNYELKELEELHEKYLFIN